MQLTGKKRVIVCSLVGAALLLAGAAWWWSRRPVSLDSDRFMIMGTFGRVRLICRGRRPARGALTDLQQCFEQLDQLLSTYREDSQLSQVNRRAHLEPVFLNTLTYQVLAKALDYSRLTGGAFDITVTPLIDLWKRAEQENRLPSPQEITSVRRSISYQHIQLSGPENPSVSFSQAGVKINVDAIAKGFVVDQALAALDRPGILAAMVDIGGEIACFSRDNCEKIWLVGIQDPYAQENDNPLYEKPLWKIRLKNAAIATSGNYRHYVKIDGKMYSHIIDPRTGQPAQTLPSVTVIAPTTMDADALATAISVLGPDEGLKLIESQPGVEAFLVVGTSENPRLIRSSGFAQYEVTE